MSSCDAPVLDYSKARKHLPLAARGQNRVLQRCNLSGQLPSSLRCRLGRVLRDLQTRLGG